MGKFQFARSNRNKLIFHLCSHQWYQGVSRNVHVHSGAKPRNEQGVRNSVPACKTPKLCVPWAGAWLEAQFVYISRSGMTMCALTIGCMLALVLEICAKRQLYRHPIAAHGWELQLWMRAGVECQFGIRTTFHMGGVVWVPNIRIGRVSKTAPKHPAWNQHLDRHRIINISANMFA